MFGVQGFTGDDPEIISSQITDWFQRNTDHYIISVSSSYVYNTYVYNTHTVWVAWGRHNERTVQLGQLFKEATW